MNPRTNLRNRRGRWSLVAGLLAGVLLGPESLTAAEDGATRFHSDVRPLLERYCGDCHFDGAKKGGVAFDEFAGDAAALEASDLWLRVLKNVRAGLMPPPNKPQPTADERHRLEDWIKVAAFRLDPANPDPGRVTVRRLNRVEYRNTIRDLLGTDFDTQSEFPADDAGHGFDNLGDVLTLSPMLLEKYLAAARTIIDRTVPSVAAVPAERVLPGREFTGGNGGVTFSFYQGASATNRFMTTNAGRHRLVVDLTAGERFVDNQFDYNKCRVSLRLDGEALLDREYTREGNRSFRFEYERTLKPGAHELVYEVRPLTPGEKQVRSLTLRLDAVTLRGPLEEKFWVTPTNHARFFPKPVPRAASARRKYARELLEPFARRAYRRPVEPATLDRLVQLAESTWRQPGKTFEAGVGQAMVAVLASPRFLFREEGPVAGAAGRAGATQAEVDEHALASRLSYFLWSTMPDDELLRLADEGRLRRELDAQVTRMIADARFDGFLRNFVGQWLQSRDIEAVAIEPRQVLAREAAPDPEFEKMRTRFRSLREKKDDQLTAAERKEMDDMRIVFQKRNSQPLRADLGGELRRAMRLETEKSVEYVVRGDRSLKELLDCDYAFLNERLARHYGLTNLDVKGDAMQRVSLPPGSPRGGVLTQGTVLAVTSNPTRTSPVKRGLFILDNILGTPPPPPPPNVPALEDAAKGLKDRVPTLRETLALHREKPLCAGCHNRMDPLGLALENFNAMGMWRTEERGVVIDTSATLLTGESFGDIRELKRILATGHAPQFYRTFTEKLLTYALGRGLEYYDVGTVDRIVDELIRTEGRPSVLISGVIHSAPFQRMRLGGASERKTERAAAGSPSSP